MLRLAAFADEISPDLDEQIQGCIDNSITHFELRGVANQNVLDFDSSRRQLIARKLKEQGLAVACIGSPVGKAKINEPWAPQFERFKIAVEMAEFFDAPLIRLFSYYPPDGGPIEDHRQEVFDRFARKLDYIKGKPVTLVHENEMHIFGQLGANCLALMREFDSPQLRMAFDFANFVQGGENPADNWPLLKPFTTHIHIKDALRGSGKVVPAGQGDGQLAPILIDAYNSGYRGFLSLEPHLAAHEQFRGFSGPGLFKVAADALKQLCKSNNIPLAGV